MQALDNLVLVIAEIIAAHCAGTRAREEFVQACLRAQWAEAQAMVEGLLAEPWHLVGYQESRLREFLELLRAAQGEPEKASSEVLAARAAERNPSILGHARRDGPSRHPVRAIPANTTAGARVTIAGAIDREGIRQESRWP